MQNFGVHLPLFADPYLSLAKLCERIFFLSFLTLWLEKIPIGFLNSAFLNSFSASKRMSRAGGGAVPHIVKGFGRSDIIAQSRPADTKVGVCLKPTFR